MNAREEFFAAEVPIRFPNNNESSLQLGDSESIKRSYPSWKAEGKAYVARYMPARSSSSEGYFGTLLAQLRED
jgi:hypothetical protein